MKRFFTKMLALTALVLLGAGNVNGQTAVYSGSFPIEMDNYTEIYTTPVGANWASSTSNPTTADRDKKCVTEKVANANFNAGKNITYRLPNCGAISLSVNGTAGRGFVITATNADGDAVSVVRTETISGHKENYLVVGAGTGNTVNCTTQDFELNTSEEVYITILSPSTELGDGITAKGSSYIGAITITEYLSPIPSISSFTIEGVEATIDQEAGTITAQVSSAKDLSALTAPTVVLGGTAKSYSPAAQTNFSSPVQYDIYASEDGSGTSLKTYTVTITKATSLSDDATLSDLQVNGATIKDFDSATTSYEVVLPFGSAVPTVTYTLNDVLAEAEITNASSIPGATIVKVTAENTAFEETYTINFINPAIPTTALNILNDTTTIKENTWSQTENFYSVSGANIVFNAYTAYQSASTQTWIGTNGNGSSERAWDATGIFKGNVYYGTGSDGKFRAPTFNSTGRYYFFRVTNCIGASALVNPKSTSRNVILSAHEVTDGVASNSPAKTASISGNSIQVVSLADLDAAKDYVIIASSDLKGDSDFYEIAFEAQNAGVPNNINNPSINNISFNGQIISNPEKVALEVYDTTGRIVIRSSEDVDMSAMKGVFVVKSAQGAMKIAVTK